MYEWRTNAQTKVKFENLLIFWFQIDHFRIMFQFPRTTTCGFFLNCLAVRLPSRIANFKVTQIILIPLANLLSFDDNGNNDLNLNYTFIVGISVSNKK